MARALPGRSDILHSLREEGRALHLSELGERLAVRPGSRRRLRELLEQLVLDGTLSALPGDRFGVAEKRLDGWEGALSVHPRGFAFVNAAGREDVFIPPSGIGAALHGDTVEVAIVARSPRGPEGRVQNIVRRRSPRIAGVLRRRRKSAWLEPDDERIRGPIVVVGDLSEAEDGLSAVVNITRFPDSPEETPEGEIASVLGTPGDAQVEVAKILARDNIQEERDPAAQREAEQRAAELTPVTLQGRKDLRKIEFLTIDPTDARDHDDSICVERRPEGYRAYVAIADVSEYVQPGSALDVDASERCFTTYLPDRAVPMLPSVLASQHCSLLPQQDRYALVAIVDLDKDAGVLRFKLVEAVIHVAALLSYEDAAATLGFIEGEPKNPEATRYKKDLRVLADLAKKLRKLRMKRGALDLNLPEPKVELDKQTGRPTAVTRRAKNPGIASAYQLVEELMLLANERVGRWLAGRKSPAVYRVHAPPDPQRLEQLGLAAQKLGVPFEPDTLESSLGVSRWLKRIAKHPLRVVLEGLLLRSMKLAQYDINNIGHFGLASETYVHFTSPIRRYPDLLVHRISKALLRGGPVITDAGTIEALRASTTRTSETERVVMQAEREVVDLYRCLLMQDKVGEVYEARISGLAGSGVYAVLDEPFVDVLLRFEALGPDRYEAGDDGLSVVGRRSGDRISLGDRVTLVIEDVALLRRTIYGRRVPPAQVFADAEAAAVSEEYDTQPERAPREGRIRFDKTRFGKPRFGQARSEPPARPGAPSFGRGKGPGKSFGKAFGKPAGKSFGKGFGKGKRGAERAGDDDRRSSKRPGGGRARRPR
ncbi:MAG TPA: VacB/RNase II family 3'-5' exoribonuclease [Polyangiaceae bacterium]|nr:VacB/RNase II family 3'-5' exoribonuclease [Polyangiaceae bacterium]